jgi:transcriptional regulator with XRE-family HTH domain
VAARYDEHLQQRLRQLGDNLRKARLQANMSQEAFAASVGLHRTYVGSVERGERNVSIGNLWVMADALGVALADLLPK